MFPLQKRSSTMNLLDFHSLSDQRSNLFGPKSQQQSCALALKSASPKAALCARRTYIISYGAPVYARNVQQAPWGSQEVLRSRSKQTFNSKLETPYKTRTNILYWVSEILRPKSSFLNIFQKFLQK